MQALWEERDRQKTREEMNLLEFLAMLEANQRGLRSAGKSVAKEPDSPRRRQAISTAASAQRQLQEEIEPLKGKIADSIQSATPQGASATTTPSPDEKAQQFIEHLSKSADQAGDAMLAAADDLDDGSLDEAIQDQDKALDLLDEIYRDVVPFPTLLERAISTQQQLIDQVAPAVNRPSEQQDAEKDGKTADDEFDRIDFDFEEVAWNQAFVTGWAEAIGQEQAVQKAVELGPKIEELSADAAGALQKEKPVDALPKQEQALRLLEEIAETLPKQDQDQEGQQQNQDEQQKDQDQQSGQDQKQQEQRQRDLSRQQAEAVLRKVRERQRERRDLEKQLQQYLAQPGQVEKDW
jgi:hypothetical protein